jgi:hypothetical protein
MEDHMAIPSTEFPVRQEEYFTTDQIAAITGLGKQTWQMKRITGGGPAYIHLAGGRNVRYPKSLFYEWLAKHQTFTSTSEADAASRSAA